MLLWDERHDTSLEQPVRTVYGRFAMITKIRIGERMLHNCILLIDDLEWEGMKLYLHSKYYGVALEYISKLDLTTIDNMEQIWNAIVIIGHERQFVLKSIRHMRRISNMPILAVYSFRNIHEKIEILDMGADDYLALPFIEEELFAKIKAMVRRANISVGTVQTAQSCIYIKDLILNSQYKTVYKQGQKIKLTKTEYKILFYLLENIGMILSPEQISYYVWKENSIISNNSVACHIRNLRKKLGSNGSEQKYIETIKGMGYRLKAD